MTAVPESNPLGTALPERRSNPNRLEMEQRIGIALGILVFTIAVAAAVIYAINGFTWRSTPFLGTLFTHSLVVDASVPVSGEAWTGRAAGLTRLDRLTSVNGQPVSVPEHIREILATQTIGDTVVVGFERASNAQQAPIIGQETCQPIRDGVAGCSVVVTLMRFPDNDFVGFFYIPYISGVITLIIGIATFLLRPTQPAARIVAMICGMLSVFMMGLFDINTTFVLNTLWITATVVFGGTLITFILVFPVKAALLYNNSLLRYIPVGVALVISGVMVYLYETVPAWILGVQQGAVVFAIVGAVATVLTMLARRRTAANPVVRDQSNTVLIGFGMSLLLGVLWLLNTITQTLLGQTVVAFNTSAAMPFLILPALSMAYAVLQYRSVDTDRILSQGITYGVMLFALVGGYFLLVVSGSFLAGRVIDASDPVILALVIFVIAVLFLPLRTTLQRRIDRVYFRQRMNYQRRLESFGQQINSLVSVTDILQAYQRQLVETLQPSTLFVFLPDTQTGGYSALSNVGGGTDIRFTQDSPLITELRNRDDVIYLNPGQAWLPTLLAEKPRLKILKTMMIAGLHGSDRLNGFVALGAPRSGAGQFTYEELRFVQTLTSQISIAIERSLVIDSLQRRVRELGVLSQVSQAANFSVDFDALLELIIAQTNKLIDTPHFYITLRDETTNELYHAFFLEGDEREREKENKRWAVGRDLFSEVVRSSKALRVGNFAAEMQSRSAPIQFESPDTRAWMGVPMNAGSGTFGVLSAATTDPDVAFTDEQLEIFNDIASLAATSIDKARLFAETNTRARQLQALNDISRQIVASEAKLEALLNLITASATEILNADAGSLLLTADDGSRDLIFRVAIGGSGADIVGLRVPAGRGLVGEVATKGESIIVNDVQNDPRWGGELSKGSFRTDNVLAVPLITQNSVIGVLEILNKRDGRFRPDEVELLTTFAGQAAVAIENARLFEQTDQALSERVSELETLERIDIELNRSLDLRRVAEITVNWAMENSSATAAMLGIVSGDPPRLAVIYRQGYSDDDMPDGAEGLILPLDRGIVSRVLRTRQPELVPDVKFDRDYVPSLRGALSQITLPMLSGGNINALLIMETNQEPRLRLADMAFLQRLTEHAAIAIANAQLYSEITRANQSKIETVGFVAHELKNPLTVIRGYSDTLLGAAGAAMNDVQRKMFINTIRNTADRMTTLVSDLEDITKLQTNNLRVNLEVMDFHGVVEETVRPMQKQIDAKDQKLILDVPDNLPPVIGDMKRLIQVLLNLVSNAHKYSPPEGVITVSVYVDSNLQDRKGRPLPPMLHVSVQDTGIGMSPEDLQKLFTPYFRSDNPLAREQPGTGIGLTITQGLIQQHGGQIWVDSTLGVGTTFHFTVSLAEETIGK